MPNLNDGEVLSGLTERRKAQNRESQRKYRQKLKSRMETLEREAAQKLQHGPPNPLEWVDPNVPAYVPVDNIESGMIFEDFQMQPPSLDGHDLISSGVGLDNGNSDFYSLASDPSDMFLDSLSTEMSWNSEMVPQDWSLPPGISTNLAGDSYLNQSVVPMPDPAHINWPTNQIMTPESLSSQDSVMSVRQDTTTKPREIEATKPPAASKSLTRRGPPKSMSLSGDLTGDLGADIMNSLRITDTPAHRSLLKTAIARGHNIRDVLLAGLGALSQTTPPPKITHSIALTRAPTLTSYLNIARAIGFSKSDLHAEHGTSPFYRQQSVVALPSYIDNFPNMRPTPAQTTEPHHPWVDILPWPELRERILTSAELDRDAIKMDIFMNDGIRCWQTGQPWDTRSWEAEGWFVEKWGWVLGERSELMDTTRWWRGMRREGKI